jgi:hypothetical protein
LSAFVPVSEYWKLTIGARPVEFAFGILEIYEPRSPKSTTFLIFRNVKPLYSMDLRKISSSLARDALPTAPGGIRSNSTSGRGRNTASRLAESRVAIPRALTTRLTTTAAKRLATSAAAASGWNWTACTQRNRSIAVSSRIPNGGAAIDQAALPVLHRSHCGTRDILRR